MKNSKKYGKIVLIKFLGDLTMTFSPNHWIIYAIVALIILAVIGQAVFFMAKALKRAKEIGIAKSKIKKYEPERCNYCV